MDETTTREDGAQLQEGAPSGACNSPGCRCQDGHPDRPDPDDPKAVREARERQLEEHIQRGRAAALDAGRPLTSYLTELDQPAWLGGQAGSGPQAEAV